MGRLSYVVALAETILNMFVFPLSELWESWFWLVLATLRRACEAEGMSPSPEWRTSGRPPGDRGRCYLDITPLERAEASARVLLVGIV